MKKKLPLALAAAAGLIVLLIIGHFAGVHFLSGPPADTDDSLGVTAPTEPSAVGATVCVLNTDSDRQALWQTLADAYTAETGVKVQIVSHRDQATLLSLAPGDTLPENPLDLSHTDAYIQLADLALSMQDDRGRVLAVASEIQVFGLVYNSTLLAQTGHTRADISGFKDLTEVVYGIADNQSRYGFSAFIPVDPNGHFASQVTAMPSDCRNLVDLILNIAPQTSLAEENSALHSFLEGKAVFLPAGSAEHDTLNAIGSENLGVLPVYTGAENEENQTLCVSAAGYWCIDADAKPEDVQATVDFLNYLTRPGTDGAVPVDSLQIMSPYRQATYKSNMLESVLRYDLAQGKKPVVCRPVQIVPLGLSQAITTYAQDPSDENWRGITELLH